MRTGSFCDLPDVVHGELLALMQFHEYRRGSTLFLEGQPAKGVYLLCAGRAKLSTYSEDGKAIILCIAEAGEVLGLSANIAGSQHETTAQATEDCRIGFVGRQDFLDFINSHHEASLNALRQLSSNYRAAHQQICSLGLSLSAGDKLARLFLQWYDRFANSGPVRISSPHTHGEIAEMIGTSRETVTRLLKDFKDRGLIAVSRSELCIPDRQQLIAAIGSRHRNGNGHV
jgi:CRP/FNR family transcriptional regulator